MAKLKCLASLGLLVATFAVSESGLQEKAWAWTLVSKSKCLKMASTLNIYCNSQNYKNKV